MLERRLHSFAKTLDFIKGESSELEDAAAGWHTPMSALRKVDMMRTGKLLKMGRSSLAPVGQISSTFFSQRVFRRLKAPVNRLCQGYSNHTPPQWTQFMLS